MPIGILRSTHGATPIETWTAYEGFADHPKLQPSAERIRQSNPTTAEGKEAYAKYYDALSTLTKRCTRLTTCMKSAA